MRPAYPRENFAGRGTIRPTFLALRDHGKVFVADLPRLSDGQLNNVGKEAQQVLDSLNRRLQELDSQPQAQPLDQDTRIRASTKRDVTERFIRSVEEEQEQRRSNPSLRAAAGESLARAFLEVARHRLSGASFDSLLQEALQACGPQAAPDRIEQDPPIRSTTLMPVVLTPEPESQAVSSSAL